MRQEEGCVLNRHYTYYKIFIYVASSSVQCRVKTMLTTELYRKSLRRRDLSAATASPSSDTMDQENDSDEDKKKEEDAAFTTGAIVNLMGTDTSRISEFATVWFALVSAPIQLFVGILFLYQLMGVSCLYDLLAMIVRVNHFNTKIFVKT